MALRGGCSRIGRFVRLAAAALISVSALSIAGAPAQAHHYRHHRYYAIAHHPHYHYVRRAIAAIPASPAFSAIVVDANSGRTLYSADETGLRHPASITKVMTLYLLFEELDKGAMTLRTQIPISGHAAAQEPSKLGLAPGETISVEDAIKAVVTRSANDVAVAIGEAIGQTEDNFADLMTRKARALGMSSTVYRNASGLPNDQQVTTARDLTTLARALEDRFPRYFHYFSTHEFAYAGEVIGNHNHLLGRVDGVDGIKTGYTRASGFNLLTSVHRDGRYLIAVVMGGGTAGVRDRFMENLIEDHIAQASTAHTATMVAEASVEETAPRAAGETPRGPRPAVVAASPPVRALSAQTSEPQLAEGDNSDEDGDESPHVAAIAPVARPRPVEQPTPQPVSAKRADPAPKAIQVAQAQSPARPATTVEPTPAQLGWAKGPDPAAKSPKTKSAEASARAKTPAE